MKKTISIILVAIIAVGTLSCFAGCNLFNNGSIDELDGIYGLNSYYFRDVESNTHTFGDKYEYYLLVINGSTAYVVYKKIDGEEYSYSTSLTTAMSKDSDGGESVDSITVLDFRGLTFGGSGDNYSTISATEAYKFNFYPMRETLTYKDVTLKRNSNDGLVSVRTQLSFIKMYNKTDNNRIEKAKIKQLNTIDSRSDNTSSEEDE